MRWSARRARSATPARSTSGTSTRSTARRTTPTACPSSASRSRYHVAGEPACGVVYDPHHDDLYAAERGAGATLDGVPLRVSAVDRLDRALVVAQAQSSDPAVLREFAALVELLMNAARGLRFPGAPALVLALIAAGRLEAYCERAMDPWDIAAGQLLLEEAGGRLTRFDGAAPTTGETGDVVATNGRIHDELLRTLEAT